MGGPLFEKRVLRHEQSIKVQLCNGVEQQQLGEWPVNWLYDSSEYSMDRDVWTASYSPTDTMAGQKTPQIEKRARSHLDLGWGLWQSRCISLWWPHRSGWGDRDALFILCVWILLKMRLKNSCSLSTSMPMDVDNLTAQWILDTDKLVGRMSPPPISIGFAGSKKER